METLGRTVLSAFLMLGLCSPVRAQTATPFRLGIMEDMSGAYRDLNGPGDVVAANLAVEDFGGHVLGRPIEVLSGDMQNSVDAGMTLARHWYDVDGVQAIFGLGNSAVALAVQQLGATKNRISIGTSSGSSARSSSARIVTLAERELVAATATEAETMSASKVTRSKSSRSPRVTRV